LETGDKKDPRVSGPRKLGKTTNYACVYGAGPATIAINAGISEEQAKDLHTAYWKIHNYVKLIAEEQCIVRDSKGNNWLVNPINGFCYSLRTEKDKFSTLIQGTGSYFFDLWVDGIMEDMMKRFKTKRLLACFHDEYISRFKDSEKARDAMTHITKTVLCEINKRFSLRRDLDCGIEFGKRYSEIH
jgi:DNA polymerase I-like protein with 3'-5' exonuclease and polymerase domains